ncbi:MAG TPA: FtsX-like permease family protein [Ignavibacteria bacterium]|nr:FtsX-like permease family protein [Ignavibacteria bacterium]
MKTGRIIKTAFRGLSKNKLRTFFMMIGIVIGITAITMVISVGLGAEDRVMERVKKFGLESIMIYAGGGTEMGRGTGGQPVTTLKLSDADILVSQVGTIDDVSPFSRMPGATVKYQELSANPSIQGVTFSYTSVWDIDVSEGRFISYEDDARMARVCVIAPTVQKELFGEINPIGEQIRIGNVPFEIIGILQQRGTSPGGGDMDNRIMIPLQTLMRRTANVDYISGIKVKLNTTEDLEKTEATITSILRERHKLAEGEPDDFRIITPTEVTQFAEKVAGTFNIFLVLVAGISLIAGGFVITNIMLISVSERKNEIGLRKAVGARRKDIQTQFLLETIAVTFIGGVIGILLGFAGAMIISVIIEMPAAYSWEGIAAGVLFSSLVGLIAGMQPARRASELDPIEALRS